MNIMDTFAFVMKPDDKGVVKKLDEIDVKSKAAAKAVESVSENFEELGSQIKDSISQAIPGSEKLINNLTRIGTHARNALAAIRGNNTPGDAGAAASRLNLKGGASRPVALAGAGGGAAGGAGGAGGAAAGAAGGAMAATAVAATAAAVALAVLAVGVGTLTKAFLDSTERLKQSRDAARDAGVNNVQMAATEQYAKSMRLSAQDAQEALKKIGDTTREGWVKSRERGNIFGIGNEQTQMLKRYGIRTSDSRGELRNSTAIFEDIGKKMKTMGRDSAIAFGEFFGMSKDFAAGVYDSKQSLTEFAQANRESIATQAQAMADAKKYEQAQQALANAWDDFSIKVGSKLIPVVTDLINLIIDAVDAAEDFGAAVYGQIMMVKDTAESVFDWLMGMRTKVVDFIFGDGATEKIDDAQAKVWGKVGEGLAAAGDAFKAGMDRSAEYGRNRNPTDAAKFDRDMKANTSLNAKAANVQLEAANLMKTATAKFGLSTEQFYAMWAATSGKMSGLQSGGGMTTAGFRDAYKEVTSKYASPEAAVWMYGRGQPMMQQMPTQYAMGMGVNQYGMPSRPVGLDRAQEAVRSTSAPVGPTASPFGGDRSKGGRGGGDKKYEINLGGVNIHTKSTDPNEINSAVANGMVDNLKFALNKIGTGEIA